MISAHRETLQGQGILQPSRHCSGTHTPPYGILLDSASVNELCWHCNSAVSSNTMGF